MMIPDKRRVATMILSRMNGEGVMSDTEAKPQMDMREEGPLDIIAQDLLQAIQEKSVSGIKDAIRAMIVEINSSESEE
jgi:hypothetical protein